MSSSVSVEPIQCLKRFWFSGVLAIDLLGVCVCVCGIKYTNAEDLNPICYLQSGEGQRTMGLLYVSVLKELIKSRERKDKDLWDRSTIMYPKLKGNYGNT